MTKPPKPLTPKDDDGEVLTSQQETFAQAVAANKTLSDAYREAYNVGETTKDKSVNEEASRTAAIPKIASRIRFLKQELAAKILWTKEQSVAILAKIAQEEAELAKDKIAAVKELNAMHGHNAPTKVEADVTLRNAEKADKDIIGSIFNKLNKG